MTIEDLMREGKIKPLKVSRRSVEARIDMARENIRIAEATFDSSPDWALNIAYASCINSLTAFMMAKGYRPASETAHHVAIIEFSELFLDADLVNSVDRMRRKRSTATYDPMGTVSDDQARSAIRHAKAVLSAVEDKLKSTV